MPGCSTPPQAGAVALYLGRPPAAPRILPFACAVQCVLLLLRLQVGRRGMHTWLGGPAAQFTPGRAFMSRAACRFSVEHCPRPPPLERTPLPPLAVQFYCRVFPATRFAFVDDLMEVVHIVRAPLL